MKARSVKLVSIFAAFALVFSICGVLAATQTAHAASAYNYKPAKAVSYAKKHWNDKKEADKGKPDCVKFVRACVEAGGVVRDKAKKTGYTPEQYIAYITGKKLATKYLLTPESWAINGSYKVFDVEENAGKVAKGDILFYKCKKCKRIFHLALAADFKGSDIVTLYAHNVPQNNKPCLMLNCSRCKAPAKKTDVYSLHFRCKDNGFDKKGKLVQAA